MRVDFLDLALAELRAAQEYYNQQQPGLGDELVDEVRETSVRIKTDPLRWSELVSGVRRCITHRFPYALLYSIENESILVIAVMHLHREPGYWRSRLPK